MGEARANGPAASLRSSLPIGTPNDNDGGSVVTASGLTFIAAATDNLIRAIDIKSGKVVRKCGQREGRCSHRPRPPEAAAAPAGEAERIEPDQRRRGGDW
jgi:hypothetical protein